GREHGGEPQPAGGARRDPPSGEPGRGEDRRNGPRGAARREMGPAEARSLGTPELAPDQVL
ncbi:MAG: hypothetical protein AVDCRST_MAG08-1916, partial [uncultured Acetobacteraceae bacterium]